VARDQLLASGLELRRATEAVAAARRRLPAGGIVPENYIFQGVGPDGLATDVRLLELFRPGIDSLVIYSMMFPRDAGDVRPGPAVGETAHLPRAEGRVHRARRFSISLMGRLATSPKRTSW
jgi:predicted dithiol-disulfide oxidoreductase (DUF899 family)